jgi:hypothetical protein
MEDYERTYDDVWKPLIENEDGTLNLDQIKRELRDYWVQMDEVSQAYSEITGGVLSKPNTAAAYVIEYARRHADQHAADVLEEAAGELDAIDSADPGELSVRPSAQSWLRDKAKKLRDS